LGLGGGANGRQDSGEIVVDGGVWEAEDRVASGGEEGFSLCIVLALCWNEVNGTVELDDKATVGAAEIGDEWTDGMLAAELQPGEAAIAQPGPEDLLGARLASSQIAGGRHIVTMPGTTRSHTAVSQKFLTPTPLVREGIPPRVPGPPQIGKGLIAPLGSCSLLPAHGEKGWG
jgi:hypothetical protein